MPAIRPGRLEDLEQVRAIQAASPEAAAWNPADYLAHDFRVAEDAGRVAAFLVARHLGAGECEILNLATAPHWRRQGLARSLVRSLVEGLSDSIFLEVRESNAAAIELYKSLGFKEVSHRENYYDHPRESAIVMKFHSC